MKNKRSVVLNLIALALLFSCLRISSVNAEERSITVCLGSAFSKQWDEKVEAYLYHIFKQTELNLSVFRTTAERAEYNFRHNFCQGFFASSFDYNKEIKREIIPVDEPVMIATIDLLTSRSARISTLEMLNKEHIIGVFKSHRLHAFVESETNAGIVDLLTIDQGIAMLTKGRIDAFLYPNIKLQGKPMLNLENDELSSARIIKSVPLYLWLNREYADKLIALKEQVILQRNKADFSDVN